KVPRWTWLAVSGLLLLCGVLLLVAGLKSGPTVTGFVSLDGEPLVQGSLRFVPIGGTGPVAGAEIREGKYRIDKDLTAAKYRVEIRGSRIAEGAKERDPFGNLVPKIETIAFVDADDLFREVLPGSQEMNFNLTEKKARKKR